MFDFGFGSLKFDYIVNTLGKMYVNNQPVQSVFHTLRLSENREQKSILHISTSLFDVI